MVQISSYIKTFIKFWPNIFRLFSIAWQIQMAEMIKIIKACNGVVLGIRTPGPMEMKDWKFRHMSNGSPPVQWDSLRYVQKQFYVIGPRSHPNWLEIRRNWNLSKKSDLTNPEFSGKNSDPDFMTAGCTGGVTIPVSML